MFEWWIFPTAHGKQSADNIFTTNIHTILETVHTAFLEMTTFVDRLGKKLPRSLMDQHSATTTARVEIKGSVFHLFSCIRHSNTLMKKPKCLLCAPLSQRMKGNKKSIVITWEMKTVPHLINIEIPLNQGNYRSLEFMIWLFNGIVFCFFPTLLSNKWNFLIICLINYYSGL